MYVSKPTAEEKMELARMGLGYSEIIFNVYRDAQHNYTASSFSTPRLWRWLHSSKTLRQFVYLKDILNQAKLYICPLQKNISYSDAKQYVLDETVSNESSEMCNTCNLLFLLSSLRHHIMICKTQVRYIKFLLFFAMLCY